MTRFRRLRGTAPLRALVRETRLSPEDLLQPFFVREGKNKQEAILSMPGIYRYSLDRLLKPVEQYYVSGGRAIVLFGIPDHKDPRGTRAYADNNIVAKAIGAIKKRLPELVIITDVCLCAYTSHGHCGVVVGNQIDNDATLDLLAKMAVTLAQAGADVIAPSDMMDHRVASIRCALDKKGFINIPILSYAVKYASAFYGPFRSAVDSTPQFGDRRTYQMDPANAREALKEARQDILEGADLIMVKPALAYVDIISKLRKETTVPIVGYSVSGEYSMIKAAARSGWLNEREVALESLLCIKRAGADLIISYYAQEANRWLSENR